MLRIDFVPILCYNVFKGVIFLKCPYCNMEMKEGYIPFNSPFILKWYSLSKKQKIRISDKVKFTEVSKIKNVFYCEECKVFLKKI